MPVISDGAAAFTGFALVIGLSACRAAPESTAATEPAPGSTAAAQAPIFEVDPLWPKPLPNHWVLGSTIGVSVDADDHVWIIHRPQHRGGQLQGRDVHATDRHAAARPLRRCSSSIRRVTLVGHWGGPGRGLRVARVEPRHHGRPQRQRVDRRQRRQGHARPEVHAATGSSCCRSARQGEHGGSNDTEHLWRAAKIVVDAAGQRGLHRRRLRQPPRHRLRRRHRRSTSGTGAPTAPSRTMRDLATVRSAAPAGEAVPTPVHCVTSRRTGCVYVCDRVNDRVQVFRKDGTFVKEAFFEPKTLRSGSRVGHDASRAIRRRPTSTWSTA